MPHPSPPIKGRQHLPPHFDWLVASGVASKRRAVTALCRARYGGFFVKKALIVAVVVIVVLTGLPLLVGVLGMDSCQDCGPALFPVVWCAVLVTASSGVAVLLQRLRSREEAIRLQLRPFLIERPPRLP
jgi:hypothetical protein